MASDRFGLVELVECDNFNDAQTQAGHEAVNTAGFVLPVVIFRQGSRFNLSGALPFSFVKTRLFVKSAKARATISDTADTLNRPEDPHHSEGIAKYIWENRKGKYVLPPLTLNMQQPTKLYTGRTQSILKTGFLVIPPTAKLAISDGQHRRSGIMSALDRMSDEDGEELAGDGIGVMITCETDIDQVHQDFADCSKTKQLPPSQLAVYDRRNPANRVVIDIEKKCRLFRGRIDATSKTLGKKSTSLFLANQIRQMVKVLLTGHAQMADSDFEKHANKLLGQEQTYDQEVKRFVGYIDYLTDVIAVWKQIASLEPGIEANQIPALRQKGYICLSVTGLVILGRIGHELFRQKEPNWRLFAERLGQRVNWERSAPIWQGNVITGQRINTQYKFVKDALEGVRKAIGWEPVLPLPGVNVGEPEGPEAIESSRELEEVSA